LNTNRARRSVYFASYALMASNPTVPGLLKNFYLKTDKGRHGINATSL
jgi:hypothetical protein